MIAPEATAKTAGRDCKAWMPVPKVELRVGKAVRTDLGVGAGAKLMSFDGGKDKGLVEAFLVGLHLEVG